MQFRTWAAAAALAIVLGEGLHAETCNLGLMASLDMTMLPDGRFAVPVSLNGKSFEFLVDTGGVYTATHDQIAKALNLEEVPVHGDIYGSAGKISMAAANIASLKLGQVELKDFHIAIEKVLSPVGDKAPPSPEADRIAGFLAPDLLSLFDVELDFASKKMNLFSQDHCAGKVVYWTQGGHAELPFRFMNGRIGGDPHIDLDMTLDGHTVETMLDTGSAGSWLMKKPAVQIFALDEHSPGVVASPYAAEGFPAFRKQFGSLSFGGLAVQNPLVDILPPLMEQAYRMSHSEKSRDDPIYGDNFRPEEFILGMNVLSKLHVYIAYKERKIYITPVDQH
ncbi:MAG: aspartyl protease family protein [Alphaproteobacteria bacterium]|nr:aspartyl protease family protein [Alphaproteobacteria bacterium]